MAEEEVRTLSPNGIVLETIENGWSAAYPRYPELGYPLAKYGANPLIGVVRGLDGNARDWDRVA